MFGYAPNPWHLYVGGSLKEIYGWHARTEFRVFLRDGLQLGLHPEGSPVPLALSRCLLAEAADRGSGKRTPKLKAKLQILSPVMSGPWLWNRHDPL